MKSHCFFQVAELDTSESELLEEYKKLVKERLDVAGAALVEAPSKVQEAVKIGESKCKEHDAKMASCAGQLKLKPCAQPDCLCSFGSLALRILSLKTAETQDDLQTIINVIAGGSTALKQLNSAVSTATQEVLKAVKDCRQREKLRKKQEDSGSSRAARTCSFFCLTLRVRCFSTAAFQGSAFFKRTHLSFFEEAFFNHFPMNHPLTNSAGSGPETPCQRRNRLGVLVLQRFHGGLRVKTSITTRPYFVFPRVFWLKSMRSACSRSFGPLAADLPSARGRGACTCRPTSAFSASKAMACVTSRSRCLASRYSFRGSRTLKSVAPKRSLRWRPGMPGGLHTPTSCPKKGLEQGSADARRPAHTYLFFGPRCACQASTSSSRAWKPLHTPRSTLVR